MPGLAWGREEEEPEVDIQTGSGLLAAWLEWWNLAKDEDADLTVGDSVGASTLMAGDDSALVRVEACASCERRCAGVASDLCHKASQQLINQRIKMYALRRPVMRKTNQRIKMYALRRPVMRKTNQRIKMYALRRPVMRKTKTINLVRMIVSCTCMQIPFHNAMKMLHNCVKKYFMCVCVFVCVCMHACVFVYICVC